MQNKMTPVFDPTCQETRQRERRSMSGFFTQSAYSESHRQKEERFSPFLLTPPPIESAVVSLMVAMKLPEQSLVRRRREEVSRRAVAQVDKSRAHPDCLRRQARRPLNALQCSLSSPSTHSIINWKFASSIYSSLRPCSLLATRPYDR